MIYFLLIVLILIFIIFLYLDKDFFSPTAIICESYLLTTVCAIYNIESWKIDLSMKTVSIVILGILAFAITSLFVLRVCIKKRQKAEANNLSKVEVNTTKYKFLVLLQLICVLLYLYYVIQTVGGISRFSNFSNLMNFYRTNTAYGELDSGIPTYVNQLVKISNIIAFISIYILIRNKLMAKKTKDNNKQKGNFKYYISIFLFLLVSLLSGGRYGLIIFILGSIVMWKILDDTIFEKQNKIQVGKISKIVCLIVIAMVIFSNLRGIVGRKNDSDIVSYITLYFGGSIQLFDIYLESPIAESEIFGKETFYGINRTLAKLGIINPYKMHLEFRSLGNSSGNVYTSFRNFYQDFGMAGVYICQIMLVIIWSLYYKKVKYKNLSKGIDVSLIIYCKYIGCLFLHSFRDNFFSTVVTFSTITVIFYIYAIQYFLEKLKVKF